LVHNILIVLVYKEIATEPITRNFSDVPTLANDVDGGSKTGVTQGLNGDGLLWWEHGERWCADGMDYPSERVPYSMEVAKILQHMIEYFLSND